MKNIVRNQFVRGGAPTVDGTRLSVFDVVVRLDSDKLAATSTDMGLTGEEVLNCVKYCADLNCVSGNYELPYCDGCFLSKCPKDEIKVKANEFILTGDPSVIGVKESPAAYINDISLTWLIAAEQKFSYRL